MTAHPPPSRRTRARVGRLLLGCLTAALVLLLSPAAFATAFVPMCGERAETVAAPPPMRASSDAEIANLPCPAPQELLTRSHEPARTPESAAPLDLMPRLPALYYRVPRPDQPSAIRFIDVTGTARSAFAREIERPPR
jgi:hypothetical protein